MDVRDAQLEVRTVFLRGFPGQFATGVLWLVSAALGTWSSHRNGILMLVISGMFIYPAAQLVLLAMRRRTSLSRENPFSALAMQIAFTIPACLPLVGAVTLYRTEYFYPSLMIVVGAHYMPFISLYGMWQFGILAAALIGGGVVIGMYAPHLFVLGGWFTGAALMVFAIWALATSDRGGAKRPAA